MSLTRSKVSGFPVASVGAVESGVSDDCSLFVHSLQNSSFRNCVACVVMRSETGAEYTESRNVAR